MPKERIENVVNQRTEWGVKFIESLRTNLNPTKFEEYLSQSIKDNKNFTIRQCWEEVERVLSLRNGNLPTAYPYEHDN